MARRRRRWRERTPQDPRGPRRLQVSVGAGGVAALVILLVVLKPPMLFGTPPRYGNQVGDLAPDFSLLDAQGSGTFRLEQFRGTVVLLEFMGARSSGCAAQMDALVYVDRDYRMRGFAIISVDVGNLIGQVGANNTTEARAFMVEHGATWRIALGNPTIRADYDVHVLPEIFLLDRTGKIQGVMGPVSYPDLQPRIEALLTS